MVSLDSPYGFLLMYNSNRMSTPHCLVAIVAQKFSPISYHLDQNFGPPTPTLTPGRFAQSRITSSLC